MVKKIFKKSPIVQGSNGPVHIFFLRKAHYPNSSSFVLICFFVCFSCCFFCLLVMLHFSAFFAFSFIHQFTAMVLITTRCYGIMMMPSYLAMIWEDLHTSLLWGLFSPFPSPKNSFDGHLPLVKLSSKKHLPTPPPPRSWPLAAKRQTNKKRN